MSRARDDCPQETVMGPATVVAVGLSHRTAPVGLLERVAFTSDTIHEGLSAIGEEGLYQETALLSTCHRTEIYGTLRHVEADHGDRVARFLAAWHGVSPRELEAHMDLRVGDQAVCHLFRVAAGLESMALGEPQVLGQVREAYGAALSTGSAKKVLSELFRQAIHVGKRVRTETAIGRAGTSISSTAVALAEQALGSLRGVNALIIGSGEMSELAGRLLADRGVGGACRD